MGLLCFALGTAVSHSQVLINEVFADNETEIEAAGVHPDYIELYNTSAEPVDIRGMSLTDDALTPRKFVLPAGTRISAHGFIRVWCDTNSALSGLRANFGLAADGEDLRLLRADGITLDRVVFGLQAPDHTIGRVPDGTATWTLVRPSPMAANELEPLAASPELRLNEWMARPTSGEDWLEVYNGSTLPAALGGMVLTDLPTGTPANRAIPALSFVSARGYVRFFASDLQKPDANHLDFKLSASGETLTIYAADRTTIVDRVTFGAHSTMSPRDDLRTAATTSSHFPPVGKLRTNRTLRPR
jgi:hypothetical protein